MKQKDVITGWLVAFIISCMMLAGCNEKSSKLEKKNVKVETISVGNTNLGGTKDYVGTIEEKMGSTLSFEIAGNITSIRVEEGDRVNKGQLLATINPTTMKEAHRATLTTLKQAQDAYRRFLPIHITDSYNNERDVAEQIVYSDPKGNIVRLKDIAQIKREYPTLLYILP